MLLQFDHLESHDVGVFLDDLQILPNIEATVADVPLTTETPAYTGDGLADLKLAFGGICEADSIVTRHINSDHARTRNHLGRDVDLKSVPEIIANQFRFRGTLVQPHDIFDIEAACRAEFWDQIEAVLSKVLHDIVATSECHAQLSLDYVETVIAQLMIRAGFQALAPRALAIAKVLLTS